MDDGLIRGTVRYAHPGHDRIARESMDLRQREDELRGRWREMGFQLPQVNVVVVLKLGDRGSGYNQCQSINQFIATLRPDSRIANDMQLK